MLAAAGGSILLVETLENRAVYAATLQQVKVSYALIWSNRSKTRILNKLYYLYPHDD